MTQDTERRYEEMRARDVKRMTLSELRAFAELLDATTAAVREAIKYESTHAKHPAALEREQVAEDRFDAANLYFATVRARVTSIPRGSDQ